jgi:hypothetical protein
MTWHYIFEKTNPRLVKYQRLTAHPHAATVEDQFELGKQSIRSVATGTPRLISVASHRQRPRDFSKPAKLVNDVARGANWG